MNNNTIIKADSDESSNGEDVENSKLMLSSSAEIMHEDKNEVILEIQLLKNQMKVTLHIFAIFYTHIPTILI